MATIFGLQCTKNDEKFKIEKNVKTGRSPFKEAKVRM
jgi:hypothetical protein